MIHPTDNTVRAYLRARAAYDQYAAMMAHLFATDRIAEGRLDAARGYQAEAAERAAYAMHDVTTLLYADAGWLDSDLGTTIERDRDARYYANQN